MAAFDSAPGTRGFPLGFERGEARLPEAISQQALTILLHSLLDLPEDGIYDTGQAARAGAFLAEVASTSSSRRALEEIFHRYELWTFHTDVTGDLVFLGLADDYKGYIDSLAMPFIALARFFRPGGELVFWSGDRTLGERFAFLFDGVGLRIRYQERDSSAWRDWEWSPERARQDRGAS